MPTRVASTCRVAKQPSSSAYSLDSLAKVLLPTRTPVLTCRTYCVACVACSRIAGNGIRCHGAFGFGGLFSQAVATNLLTYLADANQPYSWVRCAGSRKARVTSFLVVRSAPEGSFRGSDGLTRGVVRVVVATSTSSSTSTSMVMRTSMGSCSNTEVVNTCTLITGGALGLEERCNGGLLARRYLLLPLPLPLQLSTCLRQQLASRWPALRRAGLLHRHFTTCPG